MVRLKDAVMHASPGELHILVATSVIEVGIDVPNASVMLIEHAEHFGLAQLHQFRGRVGRGEHRSYCLLITETPSGDAIERLSALEQTTDGFKLAEIDWRLRGAGDLLGTRQAGEQQFRLAELMNPRLVELASAKRAPSTPTIRRWNVRSTNCSPSAFRHWPSARAI